MKTFLVTIPVAVPDEIGDIDVCGVVNRLVNIGLEDAADTSSDESLDGCEEAREILLLQFEEPFMYDDDAKGVSNE